MKLISNPQVAYINPTYNRRTFVYWSLGNYCTYNCSYCPSRLKDGSIPYQPVDVVQKTLEKLPNCDITFGGGEPTYHPQIEMILNNKYNDIRFGIHSNASRPLAFWERIVDRLHVVKLTYHSESAKIDRFIDAAKLIYEKNPNGVRKRMGSINITMIPDRWSECIKTYDRLIANDLPVVVKPLLENFGSASRGMISEYSSEQIQWINQKHSESQHKLIGVYNSRNELMYSTSPAEIISTNQANFSGWKCYSNISNMTINADGKVYDTSCAQQTCLGTIYSEFFTNQTPIICKQNFCWCLSDIQAKKTKF